MSDLVIDVRQISNYPPQTQSGGSETVLLQAGGLGGPYQSITTAALVRTALQFGSIGIGNSVPADSSSGQVYTDAVVTPLNGWIGANFYDGNNQGRYWTNGPAMQLAFNLQGPGITIATWPAGTAGQPIDPLRQRTIFALSTAGDLELPSGTLQVARNPGAAMEVATASFVQATTVASFNQRRGPVALLSSDIDQALGITPPDFVATDCSVQQRLQELLAGHPFVWSFNARVGNIWLHVDDVTRAYFAPHAKPVAPTPPANSNDFSIATTQWVNQNLHGNFWTSLVAMFAPISSPNFTGIPTAPNPDPNANDSQIATTQWVMDHIVQSIAGVASFNGRVGAVTLQASDLNTAAAGGPYLPLATGGTVSGSVTIAGASNALTVAGTLYAPTIYLTRNPGQTQGGSWVVADGTSSRLTLGSTAGTGSLTTLVASATSAHPLSWALSAGGLDMRWQMWSGGAEQATDNGTGSAFSFAYRIGSSGNPQTVFTARRDGSGISFAVPVMLAAAPTQNLQAATRQYVDTAPFLPIGGGTILGPIDWSGTPTAPTTLTPKQYVDAAVASAQLFAGTWNVPANIPDLSGLGPTIGQYWIVSVAGVAPPGMPPISGQTMNAGDMVIFDTPGWVRIAAGGITQAQADARYLQLTGGTIVNAATATTLSVASSGSYARIILANLVQPAAGNVSTLLALSNNNNQAWGLYPGDNQTTLWLGPLTLPGYTPASINAGSLGIVAGGVTFPTGSTITVGAASTLTFGSTCTIDFGSFSSVTLGMDPTQPLQAATKQYVDSITGNYLPLSGGVITGPLTVLPLANNWSSYKVVRVGDTTTVQPGLLFTNNHGTVGMQSVGFVKFAGALYVSSGSATSWTTDLALFSTDEIAFLRQLRVQAAARFNNTVMLNSDPVNPLEAVTKRYADSLIAGGPFLPSAGGTIAGQLVIADPVVRPPGTATLSVRANPDRSPPAWTSISMFCAPDPAVPPGDANAINGYKNELLRWRLVLPDTELETGFNAGSNFLIQRFDDTGTIMDVPNYAVGIERSSGQMWFRNGFRVQGGSAQLFADPVNPLDAVTKQYVDTNFAPGTGAFLPLAGGTLSGALTIQADGTTPGTPRPKLFITGTGTDWPAIIFNTTQPPANSAAGFIQARRNGLPRWSIELGTGVQAESGGNTGSGFLINRFADDGTPLSPSPVSINRADGTVTNGTVLMLASDPTQLLQAATKRYVDNTIAPVSAQLANYLPLAGGTINPGPLTVLPQAVNWGTLYRMGIVVGDTTMQYPGILFVNNAAGNNGAIALLRYQSGLWISNGTPTAYVTDIARFDAIMSEIFTAFSVRVLPVGVPNAAGGAIALTAGRGDGTGWGGAITLTTGQASVTSRAGDFTVAIPSSPGGVGGVVTITSGNSSSSAGGSITIQTGNSTAGTFAAGQLNLVGGTSSTGSGGNISIRGGASSSGTGGGLILIPGAGGSGTAGNITLFGATGANQGNLIFNMTNMRSWQITALPTVDPGIADAIWSYQGVLMQSGATPPWTAGLANYLPLAGGVISGPIDWAGTPTSGTNLTTKAYVDSAVANASQFQGTWDVANNVPDLTAIVPLNGQYWIASSAGNAPAGLPGIGGQPVTSGDTVIYQTSVAGFEIISGGGMSQAQADARYLQLIGGTLSGNLVLSPSAGGSQEVIQVYRGATKYVTLDVTATGITALSSTAQIGVYGPNNGTLQIQASGQLVISSTPGVSLISTGEMTVSHDPTSSLGIATKQYIDNAFLPLAGGTLSGHLSVTNGNVVVGTNTQGNSFWLNAPIGATNVVRWQRGGVPRWDWRVNGTPESGSNAGSDLQLAMFTDAGGNLGFPLVFTRATGLGTVMADPTDPLGIATKQYVDGRLTFVSVRDHGVVGDGVTDDTAALQTVLNSYAGRAVVFIPDTGSPYMTSGITLPSGTTLVLNGTIMLLPNSPAFVVTVSYASHVTIRGNGTIDGNSAAQATHPGGMAGLAIDHSSFVLVTGIRLTNSFHWPLNVTVSNSVTIDAVSFLGGGAANEFAAESYDCWLTNCTIDGTGNGDYAFCFYGGVHDSGAIGNTVKNAGAGTPDGPPGIGVMNDSAQPASCSNIVIANNVVHGCAAGGITCIGQNTNSGIIIANNRCYDNCHNELVAGQIADCFVDNTNGITISGNQFGSGLAMAGIFLDGTVSYAHVTDNQVYNMSGGAEPAGMWINGASNVYVSGNYFYDNQPTPTMAYSVVGFTGPKVIFGANFFDRQFAVTLAADTVVANFNSNGFAVLNGRFAIGAAPMGITNTNGAPRWYMGNQDNPETGSNTGSDFAIDSVDDAGTALLASPLVIRRATGEVTLTSDLHVNSNGIVYNGGNQIAFAWSGTNLEPIIDGSNLGPLMPMVSNVLPTNAADDAGAASAGVMVGGVYRNGSALMIRTI